MIQRPSCQKAALVLKCTKKQLSAAIILYQGIIQAQGSPTESLLHPLHSFFATLLQSGDLTPEDFGCPTDQAIFLLSIRPNNSYSMSSTVASNCAAFRYCLHSIFVHVVREKFLSLTTFEFFKPPSPPNYPKQAGNIYEEDENQGGEEDEEEEKDEDDEDEEKLGDADEIEEENLESMLDKIMQRTYSCKNLSSYRSTTLKRLSSSK